MFRWLVIACLAGCGRVGFERSDDASGVADAPDAPDAPIVCTGPYADPRWLEEVSSSGDDWGGFITEDGLELYFASDRPGGAGATDLYVATRGTTTAQFGAPQRIVELASAVPDDNPFVDADGLGIWFDDQDDIKYARRATRSSPWELPQIVSELASPDMETAVSLSPDGLDLYLSSTRTGSEGDYDLYVAKRAAIDQPFGIPVHQPAPSTNGFDCCVSVRSGGNSVLFTTRQFDGNFHIGAASRAADGTLAAATQAPDVPAASGEIDAFSTRNDRWLGFSSSGPPGLGGRDLFLRERACP